MNLQDFFETIRNENPERWWEIIRIKAFERMTENIKEAKVEQPMYGSIHTEEWCKWMCDISYFPTTRRCREAFERLLLRQRVIHDIKSAHTEVEVLGRKISMPIMFTPISERSSPILLKGVNKSNFIEVSKAAAKANTIVWIGYPTSQDTVKKVAKKKLCPLIWIIKPLKDQDELAKNIAFAERIGLLAVGVDLDSCAGLFSAPDSLGGTIGLRRSYEPAPLSLDELKSLREKTSLPFIMKGILSKEEAEAAVKVGANAIVVSNHGGHALDYSRPSIEVLPEIKKTVGDKVEIYLDTGIRRGADVLKALALGAKAVLIGRVMLWGLAIGEGEGAYRLLSLLTEELRRDMILTGVASAAAVPSEIIYRPT